MAISGYDLRGVASFLRKGDVTRLSGWDKIKDDVFSSYPALKMVLDQQAAIESVLECIADKIDGDADDMIAKEENEG